MRIELGSKVRDRLSGYAGTVTARTEWLWGCVRLGVSSGQLHEGKPVEAVWFDEAELELVEPAAAAPALAATGGPQRATGARPRTG